MTIKGCTGPLKATEISLVGRLTSIKSWGAVLLRDVVGLDIFILKIRVRENGRSERRNKYSFFF